MEEQVIGLLAGASTQAQQIRGELLALRMQQHITKQLRNDCVASNDRIGQSCLPMDEASKLRLLQQPMAHMYASGERSASPRMPDEAFSGLRTASSGTRHADTGLQPFPVDLTLKAALVPLPDMPEKHYIPTQDATATATSAFYITNHEAKDISTLTLPPQPAVGELAAKPRLTLDSNRTTEEAVLEVLSGQMDDGTGLGRGFPQSAAGEAQSCEGFVSLLLSPRTTRERVQEELGLRREPSQTHSAAGSVGSCRSEGTAKAAHQPSDSAVLMGSPAPMADQQESDGATSRRTTPPMSNLGRDTTALPAGMPAPAAAPMRSSLAAFDLQLITKAKANGAAASPCTDLLSPRVPLGMVPGRRAGAAASPRPAATAANNLTSRTAQQQHAAAAGKAKLPQQGASKVAAKVKQQAAAQSAAAEAAAAAAAVTKLDVLARLRKVNEVFNKRHPLGRPAAGVGRPGVPNQAGSLLPQQQQQEQQQQDRVSTRQKLYMQLLQSKHKQPTAGEGLPVGGRKAAAPRHLDTHDAGAPAMANAAEAQAEQTGAGESGAQGISLRSRTHTQGGGAGMAPIADASGFVIVSRRGTREVPDSVCTSLSLEQLLPQGVFTDLPERDNGPAKLSHAAPADDGVANRPRTRAAPGAIVCESVVSMQAKTSPIKPRYQMQQGGDEAGSGSGVSGQAMVSQLPTGAFKRLHVVDEKAFVAAAGNGVARRGHQTARGPVVERRLAPARAVSAGRAAGARQRPGAITPQRAAGRPHQAQQQPRKADRPAAPQRAARNDSAAILKGGVAGKTGAGVGPTNRSVSAAAHKSATTVVPPAAAAKGLATWHVEEFNGLPPATTRPITPGFYPSPWLNHELVEPWHAGYAAEHAQTVHEQPVEGQEEGYAAQYARATAQEKEVEPWHLGYAAEHARRTQEAAAERQHRASGRQGTLQESGVWVQDSAAQGRRGSRATEGYQLHKLLEKNGEDEEPRTPAGQLPVEHLIAVPRAAADRWPHVADGDTASPSPTTKMRGYAHTAAALIAGGAGLSPAAAAVHAVNMRTPSPAQAAVSAELSPVQGGASGLTSPHAGASGYPASLTSPRGPAPGMSISKPFTQLLGSPTALPTPRPGSASVSRLPSQRPTHEDLALSEMSVILVRRTPAATPANGSFVGLSPEEVLRRTLRRNGPAPRASPVKPHSGTMGLPPHLAGLKGPGGKAGYAAAATAAGTAANAGAAASPAASHMVPRYAAATAASAAKASPQSASPLSVILARPQHTPTSPTLSRGPASVHDGQPAVRPAAMPHEAFDSEDLTASVNKALALLEQKDVLDNEDVTSLPANRLGQSPVDKGDAAMSAQPLAATGASDTVHDPLIVGLAEPEPLEQGDGDVQAIALPRGTGESVLLPVTTISQSSNAEPQLLAGVAGHLGSMNRMASARGSGGSTHSMTAPATATSSGSCGSGGVLNTSARASPAATAPASPGHTGRASHPDSPGYAMRLQASRAASSGTSASALAVQTGPNQRCHRRTLSHGTTALPSPSKVMQGAVMQLPGDRHTSPMSCVADTEAEEQTHTGTLPVMGARAGAALGERIGQGEAVEAAKREVSASARGQQLLAHLPPGMTVEQLLGNLQSGLPMHVEGSSEGSGSRGGPAGSRTCLPACLAPLAAAVSWQRGSCTGVRTEAATHAKRSARFTSDSTLKRMVHVTVDRGSAVLTVRDEDRPEKEWAGKGSGARIVSFGMEAGAPAAGPWRAGSQVIVHVQARLGHAPTTVCLAPLTARDFACLVLGLNAGLLLTHGHAGPSEKLASMPWVMERAA